MSWITANKNKHYKPHSNEKDFALNRQFFVLFSFKANCQLKSSLEEYYNIDNTTEQIFNCSIRGYNISIHN